MSKCLGHEKNVGFQCGDEWRSGKFCSGSARGSRAVFGGPPNTLVRAAVLSDALQSAAPVLDY
jgi:hypothetical protein